MGGSRKTQWVMMLPVALLSMWVMMSAPRAFAFSATAAAATGETPTLTTTSPSPTPTLALTATATSTPTPTPTPTPTTRPTSTASPTPTPHAVRAVLISEIAWAGTAASANDEWIELYNATDHAIDLDGWHLTAADGTPHIVLHGTIPAHGFYLLERTDDSTVADIPADQIYTGALENGGESLTLTDPSGAIIDTANADGGAWPAGNAASRATMERIGLAPDSDAAWGTNTGFLTHGHDAHGNPLRGTAKWTNSVNFPTPTPSPTPT
ncbi:MAG TPA: lamin tail domain-containing protein, partial [Chloroflexi bacterium]|nr:lamin tail domain-containing protein [Chloroflexota bacterium]